MQLLHLQLSRMYQLITVMCIILQPLVHGKLVEFRKKKSLVVDICNYRAVSKTKRLYRANYNIPACCSQTTDASKQRVKH